MQVLSSKNFQLFERIGKLYKSEFPVLNNFTKGRKLNHPPKGVEYRIIRKIYEKQRISQKGSCFFSESALLCL